MAHLAQRRLVFGPEIFSVPHAATPNRKNALLGTRDSVLTMGNCAVTLRVVLGSSMSTIDHDPRFPRCILEPLFIDLTSASTVLGLIYGMDVYARTSALYSSIANKIFL